MKEPSAIQFENVCFSYGTTETLHNVSFKVEPGEFISIIGPNGGGKTTLLKLMMGFLKPDRGKILLFDTPVETRTKQIAYVPQHLKVDLYFPISVEELVLTGRLSHLSWWGRYSKVDHDAAHEALERVKLTELKNRPFGTLSSGQAQRALIARALASRPDILLLDEPTANVDVESEKEILSLLHQLCPQMTILIVTHDLNAVIEDSGKVLCVQREVIPLKPQEVCEHFAYGLYHRPLVKLPQRGHP